MLEFLQKQLNDLTNDFIDSIRKNKKDDMEIISSIKGISSITSAHFMAEIKSIDRFENAKKLAAYAGIDPSIENLERCIPKGELVKKALSPLEDVFI